jgi:hypothetical protein
MSDLWALPPVQSGQDRRGASTYRGVAGYYGLLVRSQASRSPRGVWGIGPGYADFQEIRFQDVREQGRRPWAPWCYSYSSLK